MRKYLFLAVLSVFVIEMGFAADGNKIPLIGSVAPSFTAKSTNGELNFPEDFGKNWKILFSHPRDFTPVCTSEVYMISQMQEEFDKINVKFAVISTDDVVQHKLWKKSIEEIRQDGVKPVKINFPIIDDSNSLAARKYGMIHEETRDVTTVRAVFFIDPNDIIQAIIYYPFKVGRNIDEIKRIVIALQSVDSHLSTPANWKPGDDFIIFASPYLIPSLKNDTIRIKREYYNIGNMWFKNANN